MDDIATRPRVEGDRELQLLTATIDVLLELGYDRLTMDAVANRAKASKATLYRRWTTKAGLVVTAIRMMDDPVDPPNTGTLREDLRRLFCGVDSAGVPMAAGQVSLVANIVTAMSHDEEFATEFRAQVLVPKLALARTVWEHAKARGEIGADVDVDLLENALPGIVLYRACILGEAPIPALVTRVIDEIILPAATGNRAAPEGQLA